MQFKWKKRIIINFPYIQKWVIKLIIAEKTRDIILNRAKEYYANNKEKLRHQARIKYRNLSEEEKNIKR